MSNVAQMFVCSCATLSVGVLVCLWMWDVFDILMISRVPSFFWLPFLSLFVSPVFLAHTLFLSLGNDYFRNFLT